MQKDDEDDAMAPTHSDLDVEDLRPGDYLHRQHDALKLLAPPLRLGSIVRLSGQLPDNEHVIHYLPAGAKVCATRGFSVSTEPTEDREERRRGSRRNKRGA